MKRFLILALLLCSAAFAQVPVTTTLQVQNSGSTVFTRSGFIKWNFTTGCTASTSGGTLNVACTGGAGNPGGIANQIQYNSAGTAFAGFTMGGDCTIVVSTGVVTCTKTNGTAFSALATTVPGTGVAAFLATPSSANLLAALTTKTGTGSAVFGTAPTIDSPIFSTASTFNFITGATSQCLHVSTTGVLSGTGSDCGAGGGSTAFSALTGSTNTTAAMVVGTGASLAPSGTGTITATNTQVSAAFAPTVDGVFGVNSTNHSPVFGSNAATLTWPQNNAGTLHQWVSAYNWLTGVFTTTQPAFTDISGTATAAQIPAALSSSTSINGTTIPASTTWPVTNAATAHNFVTGFTQGTGVFTKAQPASSDLSDVANIVLNNQANTFSTGLQSMSAADFLQPVHATDPATCTAGQIEFNSTGAAMKFCSALNTWSALGTSGGSVTNFSAGTLTPLFTTSVANATTTPALSFVLSNAAANTIFGNFTGVSAAPSYSTINGGASCGDATHAVSYTNGTGFGCQAITASSLPWSSLTNPAGNLALTMAANTSTFNTTTAVSQFFKWANTTAAIIGTSQSSPINALCGTEFHAAASTEGCFSWQFIPGTGTDAANTFAFTHTGSATGVTTTTFPGPIQAGSPGGAGGTLTLPEGTAATASLTNDVCYGDSTAHGVKCSFNNDTASQLARFSNNLGVFGATTSAQLLGIISDETGSGALVFGTAPVITLANGTGLPLSGHASQAANTVVANVTAGSAAPTAAAIPSGIQNYVAGTGYNQATSHQVGAALVCADASASGTAQACTTAPSFTPAANDCIIYTTTTANTGTGLTLNVNALGAKSVAKWQGTTTLAANDVLANKQVLTCYDGTNWELSTVGNAPTSNPTFDKSATGLTNPTADATFTQPNTSTVGITLNGTAPASVSTATGTNGSSILVVTAPTGGADSNITGVAGVGGSPAITAGAGGAGTGTNAVGGAGGSVTLTGGNGGASLGTGANANGGNVVVLPGTAGSGGSGTAGKAGVFQVGSSAPFPVVGTAGGTMFGCGTAPTGIAANGTFYCNASNFVDLMTGTTDLGPAVAEASIIGANVVPKAIGTNPGLAASSITDGATTGLTSSTNFLKGANTQRLTANATAITATTPGTVVFTFGALPVSTNFSFHCAIMYNQQTAAAAGTGFAVQGATNAPTRLDAMGQMFTSNAGVSVNAVLQNLTTTTATAVVSGTPSAITTVFQATLDGSVQVGASATTLNILAFTGNAADSITIQAGSYCTVTP